MPSGRVLGSVAALAVAASGYVAADVADLVPGILTRTAPTPLPSESESSAPAPTPDPLPTPTADGAVLAPFADHAGSGSPDPATLAATLDAALADPGLGTSVGVSVRDGLTGEELYARGADTPRIVASTQKVLAAAAIGRVLDPQATMRTRVVSPAPGDLILVAGGDTLLSSEKGDPEAVAGHAGLADLTAQVASAIAEQGPSAPATWTLRLDATYGAGPGYPDTPAYPTGWAAADVAAGYTQTVAMLGFAAERPKPFEPSPADPAGSVLTALAEQLTAALGAKIAILDDPQVRAEPAPSDAAELGAIESAPYRDVLAIALDDSDNALTENLARQAAQQAGRSGDFADNGRFITDTLAELGFDTAGTTLVDASGLSRGQAATAALLSEVMAAGLDGTLPVLGDTLGRLPVAGLDGTLYDRYVSGEAAAAAGVVRAKTGTLTGISSLAGTTVDADDRPLAFVVVADQVPASQGTLAARAALDRFVAVLTACGCGSTEGTS